MNLGLLLLLPFLIVFYYIAPDDMDKGTMIAIISMSVSLVTLFFIKREKQQGIKGQFLKHSILAIIGIFIVHFQYPIDFTLDNIGLSNFYVWVNTKVVVKGMILSLIGMVCFVIGYLSLQGSKSWLSAKSESSIGTNALFLLAVVALVAYFATVNPLYLAGYYGQVDMGQNAIYASLFFTILIFSIVIQECRNMYVVEYQPANFAHYLRKIGVGPIILTGIYLASVLISGDRGPLITFSLVYFSGYFFTTKRKLPLRNLIMLVVAGATAITLLGIARNLNKDLSFADKLKEGISTQGETDKSFSPQTRELAGSIHAYHTAIDYVPKHQDYLYGLFQVQQLTASVPFINLVLNDLLGSTEYKYTSSASFITWINQGDFPTSGEGTTCIADFYLDGGLIAIMLGMAFFGYIIRLAEIILFATSFPKLFMHIFSVVYLSDAIYISRAPVFADFKTIVWIFLILFINKQLLGKKQATT